MGGWKKQEGIAARRVGEGGVWARSGVESSESPDQSGVDGGEKSQSYKPSVSLFSSSVGAGEARGENLDCPLTSRPCGTGGAGGRIGSCKRIFNRVIAPCKVEGGILRALLSACLSSSHS